MFKRIFVEKEIADHPRVQAITQRFSQVPVQKIDDLEKIFNQVKKPYLQKRDQLQLFLGQKKGQLVKQTPAAYGMTGDPHYYFIHSYNCIYECEYCYLQGYFHSPDIVLFLNYEEMGQEMTRIAQQQLEFGAKKVWFHSGEYSDSLALGHLTGELPYFHKIFKEMPNALLELRTKSANIKELLALEPLANMIASFSLSHDESSKMYDHKTAPLKTRLICMQKLAEKGHPIGIHLDPIIYTNDFEAKMIELTKQIYDHVRPEQVQYISLGVVRFTKDVFHQVQMNYPNSAIHANEFVKSFDNKVRYPRPMRLWMLQKVKSFLIAKGFCSQQIYLCMEEDDSDFKDSGSLHST